jgi:two-component system CheB/CheR fusion protein
LHYPRIKDHANQVLRTLVFKETNISTPDQRWFTVRIMPYRTFDDHIDGLVITFIDISKAKKLEAELVLVNKNERVKRADDLIIANKEVVLQLEEYEKLKTELNNSIEILKNHNLYKS